MATTKTLSQKFDALHAAEEVVRAALADLVDASTGEAIPQGKAVFDEATKYLFANEAGKCVRQRVQINPKSQASA